MNSLKKLFYTLAGGYNDVRNASALDDLTGLNWDCNYRYHYDLYCRSADEASRIADALNNHLYQDNRCFEIDGFTVNIQKHNFTGIPVKNFDPKQLKADLRKIVEEISEVRAQSLASKLAV